jgi:hypothetical protein
MDRRSSKTAETRPFGGNQTDLQLDQQSYTEELLPGAEPVGKRVPRQAMRLCLALIASFATLLAGCGGGTVTANPVNATFAISPGSASIDTNCTGCNATNSHGSPVQRFSAMLNGGGSAEVAWSVSGGDATAGAGTISAAGQYTPPSYLTADRVEVLVTATLKANPSIRATSVLQLTPGFLQPLTPENLALGPNGTVTLTGTLAQAGGSTSVRFALSDTATGTTGGEGTLSPTTCQRTSETFTTCSVTYTAPSFIGYTGVTHVVATVGDSTAKTDAMVLLNAAGVASNPASHQQQLATPMHLGSSGGNNNDFDANGNTIADCCSGTLGSLIQDGNGRQYLLSNNHVLARSDHAAVGDAIVQPGLIDNNCTPNGNGPGTLPVGALTTWTPLKSAATNTDAAIAQVASHTVDPTGSILEFGVRQADGSLAAAPPGTSSTDGKGEPASLQLRIAKSGRTTGLTCGGIAALDVDVLVDYFRDCAETKPYLTKAFTNQIAVMGDRFSDAGDSGALIVDTANAEPVGLFFAGGKDVSGVSHGMANPVAEVLSELNTQASGTNFTFVGTADHAISCLNYGDSTVPAAQARALSNTEIARGRQAVTSGRALVNNSAGILGVAMGKSSDHPGEAAVIVYVEESAQPIVPLTIAGVRTLVIPTNARALALGATALANASPTSQSLSPGAFSQALTIKRQVARSLMQQYPAFFGIGVGQSLDNPREAALVIYVDRKRIPVQLPSTVSGLRVRYVVMDRLHVTRSYSAPFESRRHCMPHDATPESQTFDPQHMAGRRSLEQLIPQD